MPKALQTYFGISDLIIQNRELTIAGNSS